MACNKKISGKKNNKNFSKGLCLLPASDNQTVWVGTLASGIQRDKAKPAVSLELRQEVLAEKGRPRLRLVHHLVLLEDLSPVRNVFAERAVVACGGPHRSGQLCFKQDVRGVCSARSTTGTHKTQTGSAINDFLEEYDA